VNTQKRKSYEHKINKSQEEYNIKENKNDLNYSKVTKTKNNKSNIVTNTKSKRFEETNDFDNSQKEELFKKNHFLQKYNNYLKENTEQLHETVQKLMDTLKHKKSVSSMRNLKNVNSVGSLRKTKEIMERNLENALFKEEQTKMQSELLFKNKKLSETLLNYKNYLETKIGDL
jgi:hypothetical protein